MQRYEGNSCKAHKQRYTPKYFPQNVNRFQTSTLSVYDNVNDHFVASKKRCQISVFNKSAYGIVEGRSSMVESIQFTFKRGQYQCKTYFGDENRLFLLFLSR